ncbi:hypothetical protein N865_07670 [Intrasporangium oryzae NRRL B-24470]|uniref:Aminoglycoside phosphotransferase domain-containing protein n=1 Tax=Intrasporangium oryzae NRRL B-24470 TaxID=1386089 RepID=W9G6V0_9MICO|nr:aminoglycoside phosphotransferase family protein [Intrasporangium oryzae]EWT01755.1 hypothetical protein N865_07670 [Intrasporangium oryzae NRRL B-24470]
MSASPPDTVGGATGVAVIHAAVQEAVRDHLPGERPRLTVVAMSRDDNPKAVVMVTPERGGPPVLAVKVALTAGAAGAVRAEAGALRRIEAIDPGLVGGTVPRLLELHDSPDATLLVTTASSGRPMLVEYHGWRHTGRRRTVEADFRDADEWLGQLFGLEHPTAAQPAWDAALAARWPGDAVGESAAAACKGAQDRLSGLLRPAHVVHGDFWCGNVLRSAGRVTGVVDWEHAAFGADPVWDRVRFALAYTLYLDRHTVAGRAVFGHAGLTSGRWGEPLRYLLRSRGWYRDLVASFVEADRTGPSRYPGWWRDAVLVGIAQVAATSDEDGFALEHARLLVELGS